MERPSPEWTQEERLRVICEIATDMVNDARRGVWQGHAHYGQLAETISFLASMPSHFLEANRAQILKDAGIEEDK